MELKNAKCPNCGATIKVNPGATTATCMYCQSQYEVAPAIETYNIEHQNVENQTISGKVNVGTQVIQHQTIINNVNKPKKFVTVNKFISIKPYIEMRYDLVDRREVENGNKYEYIFEREDKFSNDSQLMLIETQIDELFEGQNSLQIDVHKPKEKMGPFLVGFFFLFFIPVVGWIILLGLLIAFAINSSSKSSTMKKNLQNNLMNIEKLKNEWVELAKLKGLL